MEDKLYINKSLINYKEISDKLGNEAFLVENNTTQIDEICNFFASDEKLLLLNGFSGSGKTYIANFVTNYKCEDTICLKYMCLETTILDDMLLSIFKQFRTLALQGIITAPKIKVDNFNQKIDAYFSNVTQPIILVIDSYNNLLKENKADIINFINHLQNFENVKVILVTRAVVSDFDNIKHRNVTILALAQKLYEKMLKANDVKQIGVLSNELYKLSKGYYLRVKMALNIIKLKQINLGNFLEIYSKSYLQFSEFLVREILTFVDPVSLHLIRLLTVLRIPVPISLLKKIRLYDETNVDFYISEDILVLVDKSLYLEDSLREIIERQIEPNAIIKIRKACIELYSMQIPLKPSERDLNLSRQTMRSEIEYHSMFIPKKYVPIERVEEQPTQVSEEPQTSEAVENAPSPEPTLQTKEEKIRQINFVIEDEGLLDNIASSIENFVSIKSKDEAIINESSTMQLSQLLNQAKVEENNYNYKHAVMLYQSALTKTNDDDFYTFLPSIYINLAKAYINLSDLYEALNYYTQALDFYENTSNTIKVYELKLELAELYYSMYKYDNARFLLSELRKVIGLPSKLAVNVYLASAKMTTDNNEKYEYYQKALPLVSIEVNREDVAHLYYEYAVLCDERDELKNALEYYQRCIDVGMNNAYLIKSMLSLAELYEELEHEDQAKKYYEGAYNISINQENHNGIYNASIRLAEIYMYIDEENFKKYIASAVKSADILNEPYYIVTSSLDLGDYHMVKKNFSKAYKYFMKAYNCGIDNMTKSNLNKIILRLADVKRVIAPEKLTELQNKYGKERNL